MIVVWLLQYLIGLYLSSQVDLSLLGNVRFSDAESTLLAGIFGSLTTVAAVLITATANCRLAKAQRNDESRRKDLFSMTDTIGECIRSFEGLRNGTIGIALAANDKGAEEADLRCVQYLEALDDCERTLARLEYRARFLCSERTVETLIGLNKSINDYHIQLAFEAAQTGKMRGETYEKAMSEIYYHERHLITRFREELGI